MLSLCMLVDLHALWCFLVLFISPIVLVGNFKILGHVLARQEKKAWLSCVESKNLVDVCANHDIPWFNSYIGPNLRKARLDRAYVSTSFLLSFTK